MATLLTVLIIICCVLLVLVVLVQNSKGGGLASNFSSSNQVMGVARTSELIEKITWGLAIALVILSMAFTFTQKSAKVAGTNDTELREKIDNAPVATQPQNAAIPPAQGGGNAQPAPAPAPAPAQ